MQKQDICFSLNSDELFEIPLVERQQKIASSSLVKKTF
jgi:hypothetical protein